MDVPRGYLYTFIVTCPKCGVINPAVCVSDSPDLDGKPLRTPETLMVLRVCGHLYPVSRVRLTKIEEAADD